MSEMDKEYGPIIHPQLLPGVKECQEQCSTLSKRVEDIRARLAKTAKEPRALFALKDLDRLTETAADLVDRFDTLRQNAGENPSSYVRQMISNASVEVEQLEKSYWTLYKKIIEKGRKI